jgi:hypothetical protein
VLAGAVDAGEGLLVQQADEAVARATLSSTCIISCWWSEPTFEFSNTGAISYWFGATSLWRVLTGMPSLRISSSDSSMQARIRSGIEPK